MPGLAWTTNRLTRALTYAGVALGSMTAAAVPTAAAQRFEATIACTAQSTTAGLDVRCPSATMAELLGALQQATGLRSEYPEKLAAARVSITLQRPSLLAVLESALSAFNFAVWMDQSSPGLTWVRVLERRGGAGPVEEPPQVYQQTAIPSPEVAAVSTERILKRRRAVERAERPPEAQTATRPSEVAPASTDKAPASALSSSQSDAQMAEVRNNFANSVTSTSEVEPIPVVTSPVIMPGVEDAPR